ncbi:hypothetical protein SNEBB_000632 [Seison nebaliae]|nr:hypothetical protein SNEBB_000632 [Seison nebaliae]
MDPMIYLMDIDCLKQTVSKCLGYGILIMSTIIKVPQILKMLTNRSGAGVSLMSELLYMISVFGTLSYGYINQFPMSSYGDTFALHFQTVIIMLLILYYEKRSLASCIIFSLFNSILFYVLFTNQFPPPLATLLQYINIPVIVMSKLNQIFLNYQNHSTGQLSLITQTSLLLGCIARIFTSVQETNDLSMLLTYAFSTILNFILFYQIFTYPKLKAE